MYVIIHISDLHIESQLPTIPIEKIVDGIRGLNLESVNFLIIITGDIAYSGKLEQYELATKYFNELIQSIKQEFNCNCNLLACPGNHDCDFPVDSAVRDLVIENIRNQLTVPESSSMLEQCLNPQNEFFKWIDKFVVETKPYDNKLAWLTSIQDPNIKLNFLVINTAWASTLNEKQAQLIFPTSLLPQSTPADIRISLLHHPYNWFKADNARDIRRILEEGSDIILTGHEHDLDVYTKIKESSHPIGYIEGGIFCSEKSTNCSFNIIEIDPENAQFRVYVLRWDKDHFNSDKIDPEWQKYLCETSTASRVQFLTDQMQRFINDPSLQFSHPAKTISLEDIYVPPDLLFYGHIDKDSILKSRVPSVNTINKMFEDRYTYLLGEPECGKTSLAKILFLHSVRRGMTPVFIVGNNLKNNEGKHIQRSFDEALQYQYRNLKPEKFWQLPSSERVAIIDDFALSRLNAQSKVKVADWLKGKFDYVFLFGGSLTQIEDILADPKDTSFPSDYKRYEIRPFGHFLRDLLIEKWLTIGRGHILERQELHQQIRETAITVNNIIGKNLVPATPIFVLVILQQHEAQVPLNIHSGSYGYLYETILTLALNRISESPEDIDAKYTYLSELSWYLFKHESMELNDEDLNEFTRQHCDMFRLNKSANQLISELLNSHILLQYNGTVRFSYRFLHYYFISRYLRDNIDSPESWTCIETAAKEMHREDYANILIFLTYLTKNKKIIKLVLETSKSLFSEIPPCNLTEHTSFLSRIQKDIPSIILHDGDAVARRRELLGKLDETSSENEMEREHPKKENLSKEGEADLKMLLSTNSAIKALQVLGQILRNFSGSLKHDLKVEITHECFDNSLRMLNAYFSMIEKYLETTLSMLAELFGKNFEGIPERKRIDAAREFLFVVTELMCFSSLRRISYAVGSEKLIRTYEDLRQKYDTRATKFVHLCLRLDHFKNFPEKIVFDLFNEVKNDIFGLTLLRLIVTDHFYLFPRPYTMRQRICNLLGISFQKTTKQKPRVIVEAVKVKKEVNGEHKIN